MMPNVRRPSINPSLISLLICSLASAVSSGEHVSVGPMIVASYSVGRSKIAATSESHVSECVWSVCE